ncbi:hypothetical protein LguiB_029079 [Lonicera macranthoides]
MNTTLIMASAIYTPPYSSLSSSSYRIRKSTFSTTLSTSIALNPNALNLSSSTFVPLLGFPHFSPWIGLKQLGISISRQSVKQESKKKCKGRVFASLFGVGAPEVLVIGVVALLVFGPKGLAEVARNLGKTLREFQPTIRELQEVSNEFKSTLEREIGLDDIKSPKNDAFSSNTPKSTPGPAPVSSPVDSQITDESDGMPSQNKAYSTEDYLKITEEQLKATAAQQEQQKEQTASVEETPLESSTQTQELASDTVEETAVVMPTPQKPKSET